MRKPTTSGHRLTPGPTFVASVIAQIAKSSTAVAITSVMKAIASEYDPIAAFVPPPQ
jgi:hypothetical protein